MQCEMHCKSRSRGLDALFPDLLGRRSLPYLNDIERSLHLVGKKRACGVESPAPGQRLSPEEQQVILNLVAEAMSQHLTQKRACEVLSLSPRTVQRWATTGRGKGCYTPPTAIQRTAAR